MIVNPLAQYKVAEVDACLAILPGNVVVPGAIDLVISDAVTCAEFMVRYVEQRALGKPQMEAKENALRGAIRVGGLG